jgi:peptide/nickel transport system substrate-binding protein
MDARANFRLRILALALIAFLIPAGCSYFRPKADPNTVVFLIESAPTNLDPRIGADAYSAHLDGLIFSSLVAHDAQMNVIPDLAERWETPDPLTYIFHLRQGVRFHDGRELTSADVKFTFDSIISGAVKTPKRGAFRLVTSTEAPDAHTFVFHLSEPYASFLFGLTRPSVGIVPRDSDSGMSQRPIGSGPFRFVSAIRDEEIVLERNPDYFGDAPKIERVRFRIVPDAIVRALELRKGSADVEINSLPPDMSATLANVPGLAVEEQPGTPLAYISFNFEDPILAHREVRQALAYATDRESLVKHLLHGQARLATSLLPPNHWAFDPDVAQYAYDPARANQLLDSAGFRRGPDGVRFHLALKTSTDESVRLTGAAIADQWERVGIALDLRPLEFATFFSDISRGSFQLYTLRWVGANNDPDIFEYVFGSKKIPPDGANRGRYRNPALDALLDSARVESNQERRKAILWEIQKIVAEDEPYINLWYPNNVCVHRTRLTDIVIPPGGDYEFLNTARLQ